MDKQPNDTFAKIEVYRSRCQRYEKLLRDIALHSEDDSVAVMARVALEAEGES